MSAHRPEHLELCAAWVLDSIDDPDRRELESHRRDGCPECEAEIVRLSGAASLLGASALAVPPPPDLKARTMARVRALAAAESGSMTEAPAVERGRVIALPRRRSSWTMWAAAAAAAVLAVSTGTLWREVDDAHRDLETTQRALADAETRLETERRWSALVGAMDARSVSLEPTPDGIAGMRARGVWDPATHRAMIVFENVGPPTGHDYELWGLHPAGPKSLGLVKPDASGRAVVRLEDAGDSATLTAFAVSLEKTGGSGNPLAPAGPVVMVGRIGG